MSDHASRREKSKGYLKIVVGGFFIFFLMIVMIFVSAGRLTYWQGWVFGLANLVLILIDALLFSKKPDLIKERMKPGPGTKWWDKVFYAFYIPLFFAIYILGSLDAGRFGWTPHFPFSVYILSYIVHLFSHFLQFWAKWTNRFFSTTVRIQIDRGHEVVQNGPYAIVRHPGYVSGIFLAISSALILGSLWALIPAGIVTMLLILRTYLEDTTLQKELAGYAEFTHKVRYRLLPGIW